MANDPRYDSRFLASGTNQAEVIYNELIGRQAAAHMRIKSRTTGTPPGSPSDLDAYLIPTGASAPWDAYIGQLAIYMSGWKYMSPRGGMRMFVEDTGQVIEFLEPADRPRVVSGHATLATASNNVTLDGELGVSMDVELTGNGLLTIPLRLVPGRVYTLFIKQPSAGGPYTLTYEGTGFTSNAALAVTAAADAVDVYTFVGGNNVHKTVEISRQLNVTTT